MEKKARTLGKNGGPTKWAYRGTTTARGEGGWGKKKPLLANRLMKKEGGIP